MLQLLKKLKLYTELGQETVHKAPIGSHIKYIYIYIYIFAIICRLQSPTKVFLQLEHNTKLLLHL